MDTAFKHLFTLAISFIAMCQGSHFRGGAISWKPTGNGREIEFTYKLGWTFSHGAGCTSSLVGSYVNKTLFDWKCTYGCGSGSITLSSKGYTCISASSSQNWELGEYSFSYTFSSDGKFTVSYSSCCWIALDYGTGSTDISLATTVDLRLRSDLKVPNTSPVASSKPLYTIKHGCTETIKIPVIDKDGDNVRCRWAVGDECGGACSRIQNAVLDADKCTLTIDAIGNADDTYAVAMVVEDRPNSTITLGDETFTSKDTLSSVPIQFLVNTPDIQSRSCSEKPVFVYPTPVEGEVIVVPPGKALVLSVYATSEGSSIKEFLSVGPPGMQKSTIRQLSHSPQVYSVGLTWVPTPADKGSHSLCVEATDTFEMSSDTRCVIIATSEIDECLSAPCFNNGTCHDLTNGHTCECLPGYTGVFCQIDIDECQSGPCFNKGTCFDLTNSFFCGCINGYTGEQCETDIEECKFDQCLNGGKCADLIGAFSCTCLPGFTGTICQTGMNPCDSDPCKNDGICEAVNSTYFICDCVDDWEGIHCAYRKQNESFINSSLMVSPHMHYTECNCFLGHAKQQHCYKYKVGKSIGFGILGTFLGTLTVVGFYAGYLICLIKTEPALDTKCKKTIPLDEERQKDVEKDEDKNVHMDTLQAEVISESKKETEPVKIKQQSHGHKHRKCWACEIKYHGVPPPVFWGK